MVGPPNKTPPLSCFDENGDDDRLRRSEVEALEPSGATARLIEKDRRCGDAVFHPNA